MPTKAADPMHNVDNRMGNINMSDDPRKEHELDAITANDEYEDATESDVESVLGSVHISKPSIKRVFFLLRPFLKPALEAFNRVEHELHELVNAMKLERIFVDKPVSISANVAYEVNYQDRKFLFAWSPVTLSLTADDGSIIPLLAANWTNISLRRGTHITAPAISDASPVQILVRACDQLLASDMSLPVNLLPSDAMPNQIIPVVGTDLFAWDTVGAAWARVNTKITNADNSSVNERAILVQNRQNQFNGTTWERTRGNLDVTLLASAARTTTQTSADIVNYSGRGIKVTLDMTVVGTGSVTLTINYKDPASGKYILLLAGVAVITNITSIYTIYPGLPVTANVSVNDILPRTFQIVVTANNANSATYSVGYSIID